ncbi:putative acetyltransferase [Chitinophaga skermanii]|uniref:Putative acetyltransferase n=1 Tax=Chitinophaga skermanii TaxID=331697 RepID=A0A327QSH0_9BACT|nr:GNAT family N-acetyltransferase [Chitinophaga skermanii]RAJ06584.1 putative acetyltransferase [Chitinophaga skermanii]
MSTVQFRSIEPADNPALAHIIRSVLIEHNAAKQGTAFSDPETDFIYEQYQSPGAHYFVAVVGGQVAGGAGINVLQGEGDGKVCELQKVFLLPTYRGMGIARQAIERCLAFAKAQGYTHCYLETLPELANAIGIYEKFGFAYLPGPMGNTGHNGCDIWMIKEL